MKNPLLYSLSVDGMNRRVLDIYESFGNDFEVILLRRQCIMKSIQSTVSINGFFETGSFDGIDKFPPKRSAFEYFSVIILSHSGGDECPVTSIILIVNYTSTY